MEYASPRLEKASFPYVLAPEGQLYREVVFEEVIPDKVRICGSDEVEDFDEEKLDAFFNGGEPHLMSFDCQPMYESRLLQDEDEAAEFMIGALKYGVNTVAEQLDFPIEGNPDFNYFAVTDIYNPNVVHLSATISHEE